MKNPEERFNTKRRLLLVLLALVLIAGIAWVAILRNTTQEAEVITHSTDTPSEEKPGDDYTWVGGATDPKKIIIPSIGVDGYIQKVGVDQNQEVAVPNNIHFAGWFVDSVLPGEQGLSVIDGHVDGRYSSEAIFRNLPSIAEGAEVTVEFGDGSNKKFRVIRITEVTEQDAASVLFSQNPTTASQLNLITCIGSFDESVRRYDRRFIVAAELI